ncbi:hypothetical protein BDW59DRAFT_167196 [Aspergillus cavernicola]|uniref:Phosphatidylethanolamine-binding protein n=1 Tax=Aspergillus cavernicola TaxID=176166 RepID=A0ABR4HFV9_9EURO
MPISYLPGGLPISPSSSSVLNNRSNTPITVNLLPFTIPGYVHRYYLCCLTIEESDSSNPFFAPVLPTELSYAFPRISSPSGPSRLCVPRCAVTDDDEDNGGGPSYVTAPKTAEDTDEEDDELPPIIWGGPGPDFVPPDSGKPSCNQAGRNWEGEFIEGNNLREDGTIVDARGNPIYLFLEPILIW